MEPTNTIQNAPQPTELSKTEAVKNPFFGRISNASGAHKLTQPPLKFKTKSLIGNTSLEKTNKALKVLSKVGETAGAILGAVAVAVPPVAIAAAAVTVIGVAAEVGHKIIEHRQQ